MTDPVTAIAAGTILNLAFHEFVKSGAGEMAKKTLSGVLNLAGDLRARITSRFQGNVKAEAAIQAITSSGDMAALNKLEVYLNDVMTDDSGFASDLRQVAQQIINIQNTYTSNREYENYGRDQINIEKIEGNPKIGGS